MLNKSIEQKYAKIISKKNSEYYAQKKSIISFLLLLSLGVALGVTIYHSAYQDRSNSIEQIIDFIKVRKSSTNSFTDIFSLVFAFSKSDIRILFFVFISGFTYFCLFASSIMIVSDGFLVGFTSLFLIESCLAKYNSVHLIPFAFLTSKLGISLIIIYLGTVAYVFSYKFREIKSSGSILRRASITYKYIFIFIYSLGGIFIINLAYVYFLFNYIK